MRWLSTALLALYLEADGHEVIRAFDGRQAVDMVANASPDLVLLDIMMPRVDGYETMREVAAKVRAQLRKAQRGAPIREC